MNPVLKHFLWWSIGAARPQTQTTEAERACLARHATGRRRLAEIGVWHGVTTRLLRRAMAPDGVLFAVDPYPPGRLRFSMPRVIARTWVEKEHNGRVHWLRMTGVDAATDPAVREAPLEFLFIDGDHSYDGLKGDWEGWAGLIGPGGVVGLHDSRPTPDRPIHEAGSVRFTTAVIRRDSRFEVVEEVDSLTLLRRS
jgi:predicted O-methyltransferase YrrM